jgi:hypothetical protein
MTAIVEMVNGTTLNAWLCGKCQSDRRASGWTVKVIGTVRGFCDDCERARQHEASYVTPRLTCAPTRPESRRPSEAEFPRPGQHETWSARLARLKAATP